MTPTSGHADLDVKNANRQPLERKTGGFTLMEVLVAFALMVVMLSVIYTIFEAAGKAFGASAARLEIVETANIVFDIMRRDFKGATVDADGRVFRGYDRAASSGTWWGTRAPCYSPGLPSEWRSWCLNIYYSSRYKQTCDVWTPTVWFRTTTAPEARGGMVEVAYRLRRTYGASYGVPCPGNLERAVRTSFEPTGRTTISGQWVSTVPAFPTSSSPDAFSIMPIAMNVYDLRFFYLNSAMQDTRPIPPRGPKRWCTDGFNSTRPYYYMRPAIWPPYAGRSNDAWRPMGAGNNRNGSDGDGNLSPTARRRRLPAAVMMLIRIGDKDRRVWTDLATVDRPAKERDGLPQYDEIGLWFQQIFFIPNHVHNP